MTLSCLEFAVEKAARSWHDQNNDITEVMRKKYADDR